VHKPEVIEDWYGTRFEVEVVIKSAGPFVYMDRHPSEVFLKEGRLKTMDRLTPAKARALAAQLTAAADEADPPSEPNQETAPAGSSERSTR